MRGESNAGVSDTISFVSITVTKRARDVLERALEAGHMDPAIVGIRLTRGPGGDLRTGFAEGPESGDDALEADGIRIFIPASLAAGDATIDVSDEHDRIVLAGEA